MGRFQSQENKWRRQETDTAVAKQLEKEWNLRARARRAAFHILPDEADEAPAETSFDRINEGRSAT